MGQEWRQGEKEEERKKGRRERNTKERKGRSDRRKEGRNGSGGWMEVSRQAGDRESSKRGEKSRPEGARESRLEPLQVCGLHYRPSAVRSPLCDLSWLSH